ncbi:hypothetical protein [Novosphingobium beihaiensis]|uniref:hypothetical protein n=1 Tax=Novosphingobium beihaiensis TaxID=2930389 RepID=UPI001FBB15C2|nr:hypothetical protein [Novosphingobium beihaiensis]
MPGLDESNPILVIPAQAGIPLFFFEVAFEHNKRGPRLRGGDGAFSDMCCQGVMA